MKVETLNNYMTIFTSGMEFKDLDSSEMIELWKNTDY